MKKLFEAGDPDVIVPAGHTMLYMLRRKAEDPDCVPLNLKLSPQIGRSFAVVAASVGVEPLLRSGATLSGGCFVDAPEGHLFPRVRLCHRTDFTLSVENVGDEPSAFYCEVWGDIPKGGGVF